MISISSNSNSFKRQRSLLSYQESIKQKYRESVINCPPAIFVNKTIIINVGGQRHEISWSKLEKITTSRLCKIRFAKDMKEVKKLCDEIDMDKNEIFFDRPAKYFNAILNFYQTGKLHLLEDSCVLAFYDDLEYWGIMKTHFIYLKLILILYKNFLRN